MGDGIKIAKYNEERNPAIPSMVSPASFFTLASTPLNRRSSTMGAYKTEQTGECCF